MMMEAGIKPVWVFDGKPPTLKNGEVKNLFKNIEKNLKIINKIYTIFFKNYSQF